MCGIFSFKKYLIFSFGAKYAGKYTGILYNDIMDDFSTPGLTNSFGFEPTEANFIRPGKRALSSMCPIIVVDKNNNVRLILGASGGSKIISAVSQVKFKKKKLKMSNSVKVAIKTLFLGMDIKEAIDSRRIHHQLYPNNLEIESGFSKVNNFNFSIFLSSFKRISKWV